MAGIFHVTASMTDQPHPPSPSKAALEAFLALLKKWRIPERTQLSLVGADRETLAAWLATEDLYLPPDKLDFIHQMLGMWSELLAITQPESQAHLDKIRKLLALAGAQNPNPHERELAESMANNLMARHGVRHEDVLVMQLPRNPRLKRK